MCDVRTIHRMYQSWVDVAFADISILTKISAISTSISVFSAALLGLLLYFEKLKNCPTFFASNIGYRDNIVSLIHGIHAVALSGLVMGKFAVLIVGLRTT